jgi:hypothetical protein
VSEIARQKFFIFVWTDRKTLACKREPNRIALQTIKPILHYFPHLFFSKTQVKFNIFLEKKNSANFQLINKNGGLTIFSSNCLNFSLKRIVKWFFQHFFDIFLKILTVCPDCSHYFGKYKKIDMCISN